jgi:uncharacterized protein (TIGR03437 family)
MRYPYLLLLFAGFSANAATVVSAGYSTPTSITVAPGQITTFFVSGIGASLTGPVRANTVPLPTSLAGISATVGGNGSLAIPMVAVEPIATCRNQTLPGCGSYTAITVQIPFELRASCPGIGQIADIFPPSVSFAENGTVVATVDGVWPLCNNIHILRTCDLALPNHTVFCDPVVTHADGSRVTSTVPARAGEEIVIYAVGLGRAEVSDLTGRAPSSPVPVPTAIAFDFRPNAGPSQEPFTLTERGIFSPAISPVFSGMTPGSVGLYQINIIVPTPPKGMLPCGNPDLSPPIASNLTVNVGGQGGFDGVGICVLPTS